MKKIFVILASAAMMLSTVSANAGGLKLGVIAGGTSTNVADVTNIDNAKNNLNLMAGISLQIPLPLGFSIQPDVLYLTKTTYANVGNVVNEITQYDCGYFEIPVSLQWGPDLLLFRPFVEVAPFIGFAVNNLTQVFDGSTDAKTSLKNTWDGIDRFAYGVAFGGGIDIWKLQVAYHYSMNLGSFGDFSQAAEEIKNFDINQGTFQGHTITLSYYF